jgi:hypothetical protein
MKYIPQNAIRHQCLRRIFFVNLKANIAVYFFKKIKNNGLIYDIHLYNILH